jgi:hypothetical protein
MWNVTRQGLFTRIWGTRDGGEGLGGSLGICTINNKNIFKKYKNPYIWTVSFWCSTFSFNNILHINSCLCNFILYIILFKLSIKRIG